MSDFIEDGSVGGQNIRGYMDNERLDKIKDAKCEDYLTWTGRILSFISIHCASWQRIM